MNKKSIEQKLQELKDNIFLGSDGANELIAELLHLGADATDISKAIQEIAPYVKKKESQSTKDIKDFFKHQREELLNKCE